jgi:acyl-CoA reductase-like NAD-dependent aldehyde dehydrogenase
MFDTTLPLPEPGTVSPRDGRALPPVAHTPPEAVVGIVATARNAQPYWASISAAEREEKVLAFARRIVERRAEAGAILSQEMGRAEAESLLTEVVATVEYAKGAVKGTRKGMAPQKVFVSPLDYPGKSIVVEAVPRGVIFIIAPWNYPMANFYKHLFPALLAGNAVVLKPSEHTPRSGAFLADCAAETLPAGLVGLVQGTGAIASAVLDAGVDGIAFTGSVRTGKKVSVAAAERLLPCSVELGGQDAAIVLADADLERSALGVIQWAMHNAGQNCSGIQRIYVEQAIADKFVPLLVKVASRLTTASSSNPAPDMGPLQNLMQLRIVEEAVADAVGKGARVLCGGQRGEAGFAYLPTLLDNCTPDMKIINDEVFGPVAAVVRVKNADEAIELANTSDFGLSGSIWTTNFERGRELARRLNTGLAYVNNHSFIGGTFNEAPWTGLKNTGPGVAGSEWGFHLYARRRSIITDTNSKPDPWWMPANRDLDEMAELLARRGLGSLSVLPKVLGVLGKRIKAIQQLAR